MFLFLFQWEHQLFCYDWLFYKCFSVPFCRKNVLTRSGYWLLITQLNCLYCTTDFLALTWPDLLTAERERENWKERKKKERKTKKKKRWNDVNCFAKRDQLQYWVLQLQPLNTLFVITVNITSYESLIVYYCKYIWSLCKSSPYQSTFCRASSSWSDCTGALPCWVYLKHLWNLKWINVRCEHL